MAQRRFLVMQVIFDMGWSGIVWAVGCNTREAAVRSFERRVSANLVDGQGPRAVAAYDRQEKVLVCWTSEVEDPEAFVRYWCR